MAEAGRDAVESQPVTDIEVQLTCQGDPLLRELSSRLAITSEEMHDATAQPTAKEFARIQEKYNARVDQLRQEIANKKRAEVEREIKKLEAAIEIAKKQNEATLGDLKGLRKEADRFGMSSTDMQMKHADIATREKTLDTITTELEKLQIESLVPPRITIVEKAEVPE